MTKYVDTLEAAFAELQEAKKALELLLRNHANTTPNELAAAGEKIGLARAKLIQLGAPNYPY